jgi:hypothetical protein
MQDPPKFTKIWIFGLKICHLATVGPSTKEDETTGKKCFSCFSKSVMESCKFALQGKKAAFFPWQKH